MTSAYISSLFYPIADNRAPIPSCSCLLMLTNVINDKQFSWAILIVQLGSQRSRSSKSNVIDEACSAYSFDDQNKTDSAEAKYAAKLV